MENWVYRFLNKYNEIIYIGKAKYLKNRISSHNHLPEECYKEIVIIEYIEFDTEHDMDFAERYFISKENPKYNTVLSDKDFTLNLVEFDIKKWNKYIPYNDNTIISIKKDNEEYIANLIDDINKLYIKRDLIDELLGLNTLNKKILLDLYVGVTDEIDKAKKI